MLFYPFILICFLLKNLNPFPSLALFALTVKRPHKFFLPHLVPLPIGSHKESKQLELQVILTTYVKKKYRIWIHVRVIATNKIYFFLNISVASEMCHLISKGIFRVCIIYLCLCRV